MASPVNQVPGITSNIDLSKIKKPTNPQEFSEVVRIAAKCHKLGQQDALKAIDTLLTSYFKPGRARGILGNIPGLGKKADAALGARLVKQLFDADPHMFKHILTLPLPKLITRLITDVNKGAAELNLTPIPIRLVPGQGNAITRSICAGFSFDHPEVREWLAKNVTKRDDVSELLSTLSSESWHLSTREFFIAFCYAGREPDKYEKILPNVFKELLEAVAREDLTTEQESILWRLSATHPDLRACLGEGRDRAVISGYDREEVVFSRLCLKVNCNLVEVVRSLDTAGLEDQGRLHLETSAFASKEIPLLREWLMTGAIEGLETMSIADVQKLLQMLAYFNVTQSSTSVEGLLILKISEKTIAPLVQMALHLKMNNLLSACLNHINQECPGVKILRSSGGTYSLHLENGAKIPKTYLDAISQLQGRALSVRLHTVVRQAEPAAPEAPGCLSRVANRLHTIARRAVRAVDIAVITTLVSGAAAYAWRWVNENGLHIQQLSSSDLSDLYHTTLSDLSYTPRGDLGSARFANGTCPVIAQPLGSPDYTVMVPVGLLFFSMRAMAAPAFVRSVERTARGARRLATLTTGLLRQLARLPLQFPTQRVFSELAVGALDFEPGDIPGVVVRPAEPRDELHPLVKNISPAATELDLSLCSDLTDADLDFLTTRCGRLTTLSIGPSPLVTSRGWSHLQRLRRSLRVLRVSPGMAGERKSPVRIADFTITAGNRNDPLAALNIGDLRLDRLRCIELILESGNPRTFLSHIPTHIELHLTLKDRTNGDHPIFHAGRQPSGISNRHRVTEVAGLLTCDTSIQRMATLCPQLRSFRQPLDFSGRSMSDISLQALAEHCPELQVLELALQQSITNVGMIAIAQHCQNLRRVALVYCEALSDLTLERLANLPKLEALTLYVQGDMTDAGITPLLNRPRPLTQMTITFCPGVGLETLQRVSALKDPKITASVKVLFDVLKSSWSRISMGVKVDPKALKMLHHLFLHTLTEYGTVAIRHYLNAPGMHPTLQAVVHGFDEQVRALLQHAVDTLKLGNPEQVEISFETLRALATLFPEVDKTKRDAGKETAKAMGLQLLQDLEPHFGKLIDAQGKPIVGNSLELIQVGVAAYRECILQGLDHPLGKLPIESFRDYVNSGILPNLTYADIEDLVKEFHEGLKSMFERHKTDIRRMADVAHMAPPAIIPLATGVFRDADWPYYLRKFLDKVGARAAERHWTDQEKLVCVLAALNSDYSWIKAYLTDVTPVSVEEDDEVEPITRREPGLESKYNERGDSKRN